MTSASGEGAAVRAAGLDHQAAVATVLADCHGLADVTLLATAEAGNQGDPGRNDPAVGEGVPFEHLPLRARAGRRGARRVVGPGAQGGQHGCQQQRGQGQGQNRPPHEPGADRVIAFHVRAPVGQHQL